MRTALIAVGVWAALLALLAACMWLVEHWFLVVQFALGGAPASVRAIAFASPFALWIAAAVTVAMRR